jgi:hypothetical protein
MYVIKLIFTIELVFAIELAIEVFATTFVIVKCWHYPIDCHDCHDLSKP